ncbi:putative inorganic phosphate cotransporter [Orchesella cincta]|uniref:Putative inorganic phosphate cotransporter n=1 Tax=Orchesella cincta TaxID=48709 RepID=A0A1D2MNF6_ORCCI|nr:putative inorganic phosphate cotransporter [Orchesella cincta]
MCALWYSMRFNISIAIVSMVNNHPMVNDNEPETTVTRGMCPALQSQANESLSKLETFESEQLAPTFNWDERDQGLILGSFFWGYVITQVPGGILAQKFGAKWVISLGMMSTAALSLILPTAAIWGGKEVVIFIRVLQGISEGVVFPAMTILLAKWTPPQERAHLAALCLSGASFGNAATMLISGHLITAFGWPAVFYAPGILVIIWFIFWTMLVYSSPEKHPRISKNELRHLEESLGTGKSAESVNMCDVPWKEIACSGPFWAIFIAQFSNSWGHNVLKSESSKYLHSALRFDIHQNAYLSATPDLCQWIFTVVVGRVVDYLVANKMLTLIQARKLCNSIGQWGSALMFAGIVFAGCNRSLAVVCFIMSGMINGAMLCGSLINPMDISPNYAGSIEGVINSVANIAGFGAPYVAGLILYSEPTIIGWRYVFFIPVVCNLIGNTAFLIGSSVKIQKWNEIKSTRNEI